MVAPWQDGWNVSGLQYSCARGCPDSMGGYWGLHLGRLKEKQLEEPVGAGDGCGFWSLFSQSLSRWPPSAFLLVWVTETGNAKHHKGGCAQWCRREEERVKGRKASREEIKGRELGLLIFCHSKQQSVLERSMSCDYRRALLNLLSAIQALIKARLDQLCVRCWDMSG